MATGLSEKPEMVALNKADALAPEQLKRQAARLRRALKSAARGLRGCAEGCGGPRDLGRDRSRRAGRAARAHRRIDAGRAAAEPKVPAPQWLP